MFRRCSISVEKSLEYYTANFPPMRRRNRGSSSFPGRQLCAGIPRHYAYSESIGFIANLEHPRYR